MTIDDESKIAGGGRAGNFATVLGPRASGPCVFVILCYYSPTRVSHIFSHLICV
jgi:hypothetical protein